MKSTKKGLANEMTKPKNENLQKTELETENLQGKGSETLPHVPYAPKKPILKPKILFYFIDRTKGKSNTGIGRVLCEIRYNGQNSKMFPTKVTGNTTAWNKTEKRFIGRDYTYANSILDEIEFDIQTIYKELLAQKIHPTAELLHSVYNRKDDRNITLLALIDLYMQKCESLYKAKQIGIARIKQLRTMTKHIRNFLEKSNQTNLLAKNVRVRINTDLYEYLLLLSMSKG